jgi:hypothetical protein
MNYNMRVVAQLFLYLQPWFWVLHKKIRNISKDSIQLKKILHLDNVAMKYF